MSPDVRAQIARQAAEGLASPTPTPRSALVGFDGFLDSIIDVVDTRASMATIDYQRIRRIDQFAQRIAAASGKSSNMELVVREIRFGGNGPLIASGLAALGSNITYVGAVGLPDKPGTLHPAYEPFAKRCQRIVPIAPPADTQALEFDDGKIMLGKPENVQQITWRRLKDLFGLQGLRDLVAQCDLFAIVNWTLMGGVQGIWDGLVEEVLPTLASDGRARRIFIDLSDPAKRSDGDIQRAMGSLAAMNRFIPVTLGLNLAEAQRIAKVSGIQDSVHELEQADGLTTPKLAAFGSSLKDLAGSLRLALKLNTIAIHPREGAAAATIDASGRETSAWFEGPFVRQPKLSTGAGDHFNAGFAHAQILGLPVEECLAVGVATSGAYVREGGTPTLARVQDLLRSLPGIEGISLRA